MVPSGSPFIYGQIQILNDIIVGSTTNDFIGSLPMNLTRSSFKKVLRIGIIQIIPLI